VLRTDHDGGVIVRTDGRALHAETWSGEEITSLPARSSRPATRGTP
jgi:hypothetical protein